MLRVGEGEGQFSISLRRTFQLQPRSSDALLTHNYKHIPTSTGSPPDLIYDMDRYPTDNHPSLSSTSTARGIMIDKIDTPLDQDRGRGDDLAAVQGTLTGDGPPDCPVDTLTLEALYNNKRYVPDDPYDSEDDDD